MRLLRLRNGRWRPLVRRLHGWVALAVGIVLLVVVASGAMLVLDPEIQKLLVKPDLYRSTPSENPISPGRSAPRSGSCPTSKEQPRSATGACTRSTTTAS